MYRHLEERLVYDRRYLSFILQQALAPLNFYQNRLSTVDNMCSAQVTLHLRVATVGVTKRNVKFLLKYVCTYLRRNWATTSSPNVKETPRSFSPHPTMSLSGSAHSRSHNRPVSGISEMR